MTRDPMMTPEDRIACFRWAILIGGTIMIIASLAWAQPVRAATIIPHPSGCPRIAFCGCGAAVEIFGQPIRSLWLARAWFKFPKTQPAPGMVAVRRHHVFVLKQHVGGNRWLAADHNSGRRKSRLHVRSIAGYVIVDPRSRMAGVQ
jgi:hypothetical protein